MKPKCIPLFDCCRSLRLVRLALISMVTLLGRYQTLLEQVFLLTVARLLFSLSVEEFHSICRCYTNSSGMSYLPSKSLCLIEAYLARMGIADYLGHRRHNHSRFSDFPIHPYLPDQLLPHRLLWGITFQYDLLDNHDYCGLLNLPTDKLQMGFLYQGGLMRRRKKAQSIHRHCQLPTRRNCGGVTHACAVAVANGREQESITDLHVRNGYPVRLPTSMAASAWSTKTCDLTADIFLMQNMCCDHLPHPGNCNH